MMKADQHASLRPLRILCVEDNPLIAFHLEHVIEDLGDSCVGSVDSFADLQMQPLDFAAALVDIDLADGPTGLAAARWLKERGIPCAFVTGQTDIAEQHEDLAVAIVAKPVTDETMARAIGELRRTVQIPPVKFPKQRLTMEASPGRSDLHVRSSSLPDAGRSVS
ncbi:MAG: hypothetical protein QME55_00605 [Brevundimonas sp.]|uniref:hypothetical protein n=1 Tax=Brevundimonas sp. TaxID=1871086 RepID=UPI0026381B9B|nr:hypothetical protein [Brevundimonas sp.]MDI6623203.1 hypothetical protein [Brevundimonas sp.]MDQ7811355.1 hypothetical protein [Brevundimonas sp.]